MNEYIFNDFEELSESKVLQVLISNPYYSNLREESKGKFEGNGDGFNCYYLINKNIVCVFNLRGNIVARVMFKPVMETDNLRIAKKIAIIAEKISINI